MPQIMMQVLTTITLNEYITDVKVITMLKSALEEVNTEILRKQILTIIKMDTNKAPIFAFKIIGECVSIYDNIPQKSKICRAYVLLTNMSTLRLNESDNVSSVTRYCKRYVPPIENIMVNRALATCQDILENIISNTRSTNSGIVIMNTDSSNSWTAASSNIFLQPSVLSCGFKANIVGKKQITAPNHA
jgi:hypothetical protein